MKEIIVTPWKIRSPTHLSKTKHMHHGVMKWNSQLLINKVLQASERHQHTYTPFGLRFIHLPSDSTAALQRRRRRLFWVQFCIVVGGIAHFGGANSLAAKPNWSKAISFLPRCQVAGVAEQQPHISQPSCCCVEYIEHDLSQSLSPSTPPQTQIWYPLLSVLCYYIRWE